jgi:ribosome-associated translation inhibitor RaiA
MGFGLATRARRFDGGTSVYASLAKSQVTGLRATQNQVTQCAKAVKMKLPVHILFHGMDRSDALEASARAYARKLETLAPDLIACHVSIDLEEKHRQQGRPVGVRIDLTIAGHELVVNRVQNEDAYLALRDAFDNMKRQLEDVVRKRRGQVKQHVPSPHEQAEPPDGAELA